MFNRLFALVFSFCCFSILNFSQNTVGLIQSDSGQANGYLLVAPIAGKKVYLIDKCGKKINTWTSQYLNGITSVLGEDGLLYRASNTNNSVFTAGGGSMGRLEKMDWASNELWSYSISDPANCLHHDFFVMNNGHILGIVWTLVSKAQAFAWGKDTTGFPDFLWDEKIVELVPSGTNAATIVWEWDLKDHLIQDFDSTQQNFGYVAAHPELINFNYLGAGGFTEDIFHLNAIDYNESLDQIMLTSRSFSEIWVIDHSTTTLEAASHTGGLRGMGGDVLYRWGNPITYNRGTPGDKKLFECHDGHWIKDSLPGGGNILVFNNGVSRPDGTYSTVEEIVPPINGLGLYDIDSVMAFMPDTSFWVYINPIPLSFYSNRISGSQRLMNNNTLISLGNSGEFYEMTNDKNIIWKYINPAGPGGPVSQGSPPVINQVFQINFYDDSYSGFFGQTLIPGTPIELSPVSTPICYFYLGETEDELEKLKIFPNPSKRSIYLNLSNDANNTYQTFNMNGQLVQEGVITAENEAIAIEGLPQGLYNLVLYSDEKVLQSFRFIKMD